MIVNDKDAVARLNSPMNLINRMKNLSSSPVRKSAMSLFIKPSSTVAAEEPKQEQNKIEAQTLQPVGLDDISSDHDSKIELALAHDSALKLLNASVSALSAKLDDVRADKLPSVIAAASKTVESIRRERNEANKNSKDREVHYHFYTPKQKELSDYIVVEAG